MKKFNPFEWDVLKENTFEHVTESLTLQFNTTVSLYIARLGYEALVGNADRFDVKVQPPFDVRIEAPEDAVGYIRVPKAHSAESEGVIYTNADRQPHESGSVAEVRKALRQFQIEQAATFEQARATRAAAQTDLREARKLRQELKAQREAAAIANTAEADPNAETE